MLVGYPGSELSRLFDLAWSYSAHQNDLRTLKFYRHIDGDDIE